MQKKALKFAYVRKILYLCSVKCRKEMIEEGEEAEKCTGDDGDIGDIAKNVNIDMQKNDMTNLTKLTK